MTPSYDLVQELAWYAYLNAAPNWFRRNPTFTITTGTPVGGTA